MNHIKQFRILAVFLSTRGFGYAVLESDNALVDYGNKVFQEDKDTQSLIQIEKLLARYQPDALVLQDVNAAGTYRWPRIRKLHRKVVTLAGKRKLTVAMLSSVELRTMLLDDPKKTKHDLAEHLAKRFPDELGARIPPKRKLWTSEYASMDMFDAVALAMGFRLKPAKRDQ